jgi:outer membrane protein TolC
MEYPARLHPAYPPAMPDPMHKLICGAALAAMLAGCRTTDQPPAVAQRDIVPLAITRPQPVPLPANPTAPAPAVQFAAFSQEPAAIVPQPLPDPAAGPARPALVPPPSSTQPMPVEIMPAAPGDPAAGERPTLPLDMATSLGLTQGQNPRVAFAQAQIAQAFAQHESARVLWLPSLRAGMNYNKHEGRIQDVVGTNIDTSRGAAFGGLGANAVGAGSPAIPGVYALFHTTDAIYQRQITGHALDARESQATAVMNDQLLETALAYLALLDALQRKAIAGEALTNGDELARLTAEFARTGAGNLADADRAAAALALLRNEVARADEAAIVASARLAQQLSADPALLILPQEQHVVPIDLVPQENLTTGDLVAMGLSNRPELAASRSLVGEAVNRLRREEHAPWLPSVLLGVSYGAFAAGTGSDVTRGADRLDLDAAAWWEVRNLGFGERAARDNARAQIQQARMREVETLDLVAREIVEAHAQVLARKQQIAVAQEGITSAQQSYDRNLNRIRNAQGLPIEVLQSIQALDAARREYLRTLVDYNTAQFRLQRALGWPVSP